MAAQVRDSLMTSNGEPASWRNNTRSIRNVSNPSTKNAIFPTKESKAGRMRLKKLKLRLRRTNGGH